MALKKPPILEEELIYPESDGKPMAENTKQFRWIIVIYGGIAALFADDVLVFVAGDLLWYPVEGEIHICTAPDVMVIFGRAKGDRSSYRQWLEEGIAPQVVFEILSPTNTALEMLNKLAFYERYGVEEYYLYDPETREALGWQRHQAHLVRIDHLHGWVSPRLGVRFELVEGQELQLFGPDELPFATYEEVVRQREEQRREKVQALARVEQAQQEKVQALARVEQAQQEKAQALARVEELTARLLSLGIDPDKKE